MSWIYLILGMPTDYGPLGAVAQLAVQDTMFSGRLLNSPLFQNDSVVSAVRISLACRVLITFAHLVLGGIHQATMWPPSIFIIK